MYDVMEHLEDNIEHYFLQENYEIMNMEKLIDYLKENNYLKSINNILKQCIRSDEPKIVEYIIQYLDVNELLDEKYVCVGRGKYSNEYLYLDKNFEWGIDCIIDIDDLISNELIRSCGL